MRRDLPRIASGRRSRWNMLSRLHLGRLRGVLSTGATSRFNDGCEIGLFAHGLLSSSTRRGVDISTCRVVGFPRRPCRPAHIRRRTGQAGRRIRRRRGDRSEPGRLQFQCSGWPGRLARSDCPAAVPHSERRQADAPSRWSGGECRDVAAGIPDPRRLAAAPSPSLFASNDPSLKTERQRET